MKQRIKLAQALVHDPDLLFLDEPTNGMDPKGRDEMLELIRDLAHNKNVNLILSSHLLPDVEFTCDHVVVMDKGQIAAQGPDRRAQGPGRPRVRAAGEGRPAGVPRGAPRRRHGYARHRRGRHARVRARGPGRAHGRAGDQQAIFVQAAAVRRPGPAPAPERADARGRVRARRSARNSMPIHDQSYRRYGGGKATPGAPGRSSPSPASGRCCGSGRSWACCCSRGGRSSSARSRSTSPPTTRRSRRPSG